MLFKINQRETKRRVLDFFQTDFYYLEAMAGIKARDILPSTKMAHKQIKTKEDARAELAIIRECLSRIHNGDGDYLSVRFLDGRSASEAAAYLNVSQSTYTEHLTRAAVEFAIAYATFGRDLRCINNDLEDGNNGNLVQYDWRTNNY